MNKLFFTVHAVFRLVRVTGLEPVPHCLNNGLSMQVLLQGSKKSCIKSCIIKNF